MKTVFAVPIMLLALAGGPVFADTGKPLPIPVNLISATTVALSNNDLTAVDSTLKSGPLALATPLTDAQMDAVQGENRVIYQDPGYLAAWFVTRINFWRGAWMTRSGNLYSVWVH